MKNLFRISWQGIKNTNFQHILLSFEFLAVLMLLYICGGMLTELLETEKYLERFSSSTIAYCPNDDGAAIHFCQGNGELLGNVETLAFGYNTFYLYSLELFEALYGSISLGEGEYQVAATVTEELSHTYSVGKIYPITFVVREAFRNLETLEMEPAVYEEAKVYICGVLDNAVYNGSSFTSNGNQMIGIAIDGALKDYTGKAMGSYYQLNSQEICRKAEQQGIRTIYKDIMNEKLIRQQRIFPAILLTLVLVVLFTTGFLGQHILNVESARKQFAVYFMCGAVTKKALKIQLIQDFSGLILPAGLSLVLIGVLESIAGQTLLVNVALNRWFNLLCCITAVTIFAMVSIIEVFHIKKEYPVDILREE